MACFFQCAPPASARSRSVPPGGNTLSTCAWAAPETGERRDWTRRTSTTVALRLTLSLKMSPCCLVREWNCRRTRQSLDRATRSPRSDKIASAAAYSSRRASAAFLEAIVSRFLDLGKHGVVPGKQPHDPRQPQTQLRGPIGSGEVWGNGAGKPAKRRICGETH